MSQIWELFFWRLPLTKQHVAYIQNHFKIKQGSKFDQRAVPINRFLYSTTVQNFTHLSYSFRVTTPIIGAGRWHGPISVN